MLRVGEAEELVDPALPQTLEQVAQSLRTTIPSTNEQADEIIQAGQELLAYDLVESVNNILKSIFQAAIWMRITSTAKEAGNAFTNEALKSVVGEAERLGKNVGPALSRWTRRLTIGAVGTIGYQIAGKPLVVWLATNYPVTFKWLEQVIHFLSSQ